MQNGATPFDFTRAEHRRLQSLKTPHGIQRMLDDMEYHLATTCWSPRMVLREQTGHCLEGAIFAASALRILGYPPLIIDLEADHDSDHVVAVFQERGHWGALAKSNYSGCRYREPVYRSLRELAMSYFDDYFNLLGERSLRTYSRPVNLSRFDALGWMTSGKSVWYIPEHLCHISHYALLTAAQERSLHRLDRRSYEAGLLGRKNKAKN
jgi:hypothetical protein